MKAFLVGLAGIVVISFGAAMVLNNMDYSTEARFTTESGSVRLGND